MIESPGREQPVAGAFPSSPVGPIREPVVRIAETVAVTALLAQLALLFADVIARAAFKYYFRWTLEISQLNMAIIAFGGAVIVAERGGHVALTAIVDRLPAAMRGWIATANAWLIAFTSATIAVFSLPRLVQIWNQPSPILGWSQSIFLLPLTLGLAAIAFLGAKRAVQADPKTAITSCAVVTVLFTAAAIAPHLLGAWTESSGAIVLQLGIFVVLLLAGVPVAFGLALASIAYLNFAGIASPVAAVINMSQGLTNFVLLAIPYFVLTGIVMAEGGLSRRLAECLRLWVGQVRGGLHQVLVIACFIFSGLSGAKVADIVAVGAPLKEMLDREGYPRAESAAVLAASAAAGETIPPSIAMLVLGSITSLSISALFAAGILPAVCISLTIMLIVYLRSRGRGLGQTPAAGWREKLHATRTAWPAFLIPLIIVGGITSGIATPTEVSSIAVVATLVCSAAYRELSWRAVGSILINAAAMSGMVLLLISAASAFSWSFSVADLPNQIGVWLQGFKGSSVPFFLFCVVLLVFMGSLLEGLPAIIIFGPLLLPTATRLGIDSLQFGIVLIVAMGIGAFSPPMGTGLYVAAAVVETGVDAAARAMIPYIGALLAATLIIVFVPALSLALPKLLHVTR